MGAAGAKESLARDNAMEQLRLGIANAMRDPRAPVERIFEPVAHLMTNVESTVPILQEAINYGMTFCYGKNTQGGLDWYTEMKRRDGGPPPLCERLCAIIFGIFSARKGRPVADFCELVLASIVEVTDPRRFRGSTGPLLEDVYHVTRLAAIKAVGPLGEYRNQLLPLTALALRMEDFEMIDALKGHCGYKTWISVVLQYYDAPIRDVVGRAKNGRIRPLTAKALRYLASSGLCVDSNVATRPVDSAVFDQLPRDVQAAVVEMGAGPSTKKQLSLIHI